jgi:hypothetical protein
MVFPAAGVVQGADAQRNAFSPAARACTAEVRAMDSSDDAVCAASASRDPQSPSHPRPLSDPELLTLVGDTVFGCEAATRDATVVGPPSPEALAPQRLAVA